LAKRG
jgi:hypothetical protein